MPENNNPESLTPNVPSGNINPESLTPNIPSGNNSPESLTPNIPSGNNNPESLTPNIPAGNSPIPNHPQENQSSVNSQPNTQNAEENNHEDTKKVVDAAARVAAEAYAPGVGGEVYDAAKNAPVIGGAIDQAEEKVAAAADKIPGVKKATKAANDSGLTDAASAVASANSSAANSPTPKTAAMGGANNSNANSLNMSGRKNNAMQSRINNGETEAEAQSSGNEQSPSDSAENNSDVPSENNAVLKNSPVANNEEPKQSENKDNTAEGKSDILGEFSKKVWEKHKLTIILGCGGILFILFVILIALMGRYLEESNSAVGYIETACNYNETEVTLTGCGNTQTLAVFDLEGFVIDMTYAYTQGNEYSDEAIKAIMITIKTNALSYGNYNSETKEVTVDVCDIYSEYSEDADNELYMFDGVDDELSSLSSIYDEISNYLYISSSYNSTISTLSSRNILDFDASVLETYQSLAANGYTYIQILNQVYNDSLEDDATEEVTDAIFIGDSRVGGLVNAGLINSNSAIYGSSYGYNSFVLNGIDEANSLMSSNASYDIVIWLGISDIANVSNYYNMYYELATGEWSQHNIYIVSLGPVDDEAALYVQNVDITSFNQTMQDLIADAGLSNLTFIDLGYDENSIESYQADGINYSESDYEAIYDIIVSSAGLSLSSDYQLYSLTTYCTYYTLTGNTAYWWPVGSSTATEGDIYGGTPVSTEITSYFGPRYHPITGVYQAEGHGAIDIAVNEGTPVIATRDGTVNFINTGCTAGDSCTGYGNYIKIDHGDGVESLYAHLSSVLVNEGDSVVQGQIIGYSGNTGYSTGPHLHFEIRINGTAVDPLDYVDPDNPRPVSATSVIIAGEEGDYQNMLCASLLSSGFSVNATIGIMANIYSESGFIPTNLQNSYEESLGYTDSEYTLAVDNGTYTNFVYDSAGYGLVQWTSSGRKQRLYNYAKEQNTSIGDFGMQFSYLLYELENYYASTYSYLNGNHTAVEMGAYWCDYFETPAGSEPCVYYGNCPSSYCTARTQNAINSLDLTTYVQNGCSY